MEVVVALAVVLSSFLELALKVALTFALVLAGFATALGALGALLYLVWPTGDDEE